MSTFIVLFFSAAEFIIDLADKNQTFDSFKKALLKNGAEFSVSIIISQLSLNSFMTGVNFIKHLNVNPIICVLQDSFMANLLRLIQKMRPRKKAIKKDENDTDIKKDKSDVEMKKCLFPGLALPNDPTNRVCALLFYILSKTGTFIGCFRTVQFGKAILFHSCC